MDNSFPLIQRTSWSDEQRRAVWCIIVKSRKNLKIELSPIVATAFILLQHYFKNPGENPYTIFTLMVSSLFAACKACDCYRPIKYIYDELARILKIAPKEITENIGTNPDEITALQPQSMVDLTHCEIDLLNAVDFNTQVELPFVHFEKWRESLKTKIPNEQFMMICSKIVIDICLVICSRCYLDLPPEVAAASAMAESVPSDILSTELLEWFEDVRQKYGDKVFKFAQMSIEAERGRTATPASPDKARVSECPN